MSEPILSPQFLGRLEQLELRLAHLTELDLHLGGQQLLAQRRVIIQLGLDRSRQLVENEPDAADQEGVENDHS